jgi:hypothetical protein
MNRTKLFQILLQEHVPRDIQDLLGFMALHDEDSPVELKVGDSGGMIYFTQAQVMSAAMAALAMAQSKAEEDNG